jgi:hypothetical protein
VRAWHGVLKDVLQQLESQSACMITTFPCYYTVSSSRRTIPQLDPSTSLAPIPRCTYPLLYSLSLNPSSLSSLHPDVLPALKQIFYPSAERLGIQIFSVSRLAAALLQAPASHRHSPPNACIVMRCLCCMHMTMLWYGGAPYLNSYST